MSVTMQSTLDARELVDHQNPVIMPVGAGALTLSFDRGTVLLRSEPGIEIPRLPGVLWDERVRAHRAPAYLFAETCEALRRSKIPFREEVLFPWGQALPMVSLPLRPYQDAAIAGWRNAGKRGIIVMPTGAGKTIVAIGAIAMMSVPTLCLVPTRILLEQWRERLHEFFRMPIGILGDGQQRLAPIMVTTFESAYRYMNWIGNRFSLLVVDEVHHFGVGMRDEALEMCTAPWRIGLTATPVTNSEARKKLVEIMGRIVYEVTLNELTGKYLAPFEHVTLQLDLYPDERRTYEHEMTLFQRERERFSRSRPGGNWAEFASWASSNPEGRRALVAFRRAGRLLCSARAKEECLVTLLERHRENKVLVFTADTETAYQISRKFLVAPITSDIKKSERETVMENFRRGIVRSLVSCRVLNEGVDVPDADVAIVVGGNHGEREHIQRIGRCLRPNPGKTAVVYELVARNTIEVRHWQRRTQSLASRIFT